MKSKTAEASDRLDAEAKTPSAGVVTLHPNAAELYRRRVADLQDALNASDDSRQQAAAILRAMIDHLVLVPGAARGQVAIELHGDLAGVLNLAHDSENGRNPGALLLVAGERSGHYHPTTPVVWV